MASLYDLQMEILECVDENGELLDIEKFEQLNMAIEKKIEGLCLWVKNLDAEAAAINEEVKTLKDRQAKKQNKAASIRKYIQDFLKGSKFETPRVAISYRKSESLKILDNAVIPMEYLKVKTEVNRTDLKQAVKDGLKVEGVYLQENTNMSIR